MKKGILILEDGTVFRGDGLGPVKTVYGELVFNTAMTGYEEAFTDPSYAGQILLLTYPLIGNYGFNINHQESSSIKIRGLVIKEPASFSTNNKKIENYLLKNNLPCIWNIDTRSLTLRLRYHGTMKAILVVSEKEVNIRKFLKMMKKKPHPHSENLVKEVSCKSVIFHRGKTSRKVVLIDCGVKKSIIHNLLKYSSVFQVPFNTSFEEIKKLKPDGIVISNGPGDPSHPAILDSTVKTLKRLIESKYPVFGICLGHQIIGLAFGLKTYKLVFGHRGYNHPVKFLENGRVYITSQNHGYAIVKETRNSDLIFDWFNLNDGTVEGMRHRALPVFSVQFHPEGAPGPYDTLFIFERFFKLINAKASGH
ncbi:MAG: glutamine-hydrolyzing carbamoyl-phosphate synthase small subunit [candidate division WOR-3 bacterium]|nr:glutamine-hydrolyzing carbamoyl-phosphate synthase small subunit [candidate division WOR-3 bacterium]